MKILSNIPQAVTLIRAFKLFNGQKKEIYEARSREDYETEREYILKATTEWSNHICDKIGIEIEAEGEENIPEHGPVVFAANHQGYADVAVLMAVLDKFQFGFVAKKELEKIPLYGQGIKEIRSVMIERDNPREALKAINEGIDLIEKGFSLAIFPEGTRSRCHEMGTFKKGSLKLATKPKVPVVPITIDGTYRVYEETGRISPAKVRCIVHPAIDTSSLERKEANALAETVEEIVRSRL